MHESIIEIINKGEEPRVTSDDFEMGDILVADYYDDLNKEAQDERIEDFLSTTGIIPAENRKCFTVDKEAYFRERYNVFRKMVEDLKFEDFSGKEKSFNLSLYELENLLRDDTAVYIRNAEWGCSEPLDDFVREADEGETYYIGNVVDYHF